ncbi:MAG: DUF4349 domain-containing protein [Haloechinothrix sp.]
MGAATRTFAGIALAAGIAAVLLAGCSADTGAADGAGRAADFPRPDSLAAPEKHATRQESAAGTNGPGAGVRDSGTADRGRPAGPLTQLATTDRKLARSASLTLRADDVAGASAKARAIAARAGGYTGSEVADEDSATLSVSVPSDRLDAVLEQLAGIGEVTKRETQVADVTEQIVDVDSRVASQRASVARVRALLDKAESISEIVAVEAELTVRESELESLRARQEALQGMVAMSTVQLSITQGDAVDPDDDRGGFLGGLIGGWHAFLTMSGVVLTGIGAALPFLIAFGIPAAALVWWLRRRGRGATKTPSGPEPAAQG